MNILITSVGRRSYLVKYFRDALRESEGGEVYVANSSEESPAFLVADHTVVTPLIYDQDYIPFLLNYCKNNHINALISLFDIDLPILAKNKDLFFEIGVQVIVSNQEVTHICNDKWHTYSFLKNNGFYTPETFLTLEETSVALKKRKVEFPLVVKPRWGMGSASMYTATNTDELELMHKMVKRGIFDSYLKFESSFSFEECVLIQEKLNGQEYGMDVINNLDGQYIATAVKKKLAMRAGETDCAVTVGDSHLLALGEKLGNAVKHIGNLDVDFIVKDETPFILDMNARFGGGYPFSHIAGVNLPYALIQWLLGNEVNKSILCATPGIMGQKDIEMVKLN